MTKAMLPHDCRRRRRTSAQMVAAAMLKPAAVASAAAPAKAPRRRWSGWIQAEGEPWVSMVDAETIDEAVELLNCVPGAMRRAVVRVGEDPNDGPKKLEW